MSTVTKFPTASENDGLALIDFVNPLNAGAADGVLSDTDLLVDSLDEGTASRRYTNFGFTIPPGVITQVVIELKWDSQVSGSIAWTNFGDIYAEIQIDNVSVVGAKLSVGTNDSGGGVPFVSTLDVTSARSWVSDDFSDTHFKVDMFFSCQRDGTAGPIHNHSLLDYVNVTVSYTSYGETWTNVTDTPQPLFGTDVRAKSWTELP